MRIVVYITDDFGEKVVVGDSSVEELSLDDANDIAKGLNGWVEVTPRGTTGVTRRGGIH